MNFTISGTLKIKSMTVNFDAFNDKQLKMFKSCVNNEIQKRNHKKVQANIYRSQPCRFWIGEPSEDDYKMYSPIIFEGGIDFDWDLNGESYYVLNIKHIYTSKMNCYEIKQVTNYDSSLGDGEDNNYFFYPDSMSRAVDC